MVNHTRLCTTDAQTQSKSQHEKKWCCSKHTNRNEIKPSANHNNGNVCENAHNPLMNGQTESHIEKFCWHARVWRASERAMIVLITTTRRLLRLVHPTDMVHLAQATMPRKDAIASFAASFWTNGGGETRRKQTDVYYRHWPTSHDLSGLALIRANRQKQKSQAVN